MRLYNFDHVLFDDGAGESNPAGCESRNGSVPPQVDDDRDATPRQPQRAAPAPSAPPSRRAASGPGLWSITGEPP